MIWTTAQDFVKKRTDFVGTEQSKCKSWKLCERFPFNKQTGESPNSQVIIRLASSLVYYRTCFTLISANLICWNYHSRWDTVVAGLLVLTCVDVGAEVLSGEAEAMVAPFPVCSMKRIPTCTGRQDPSSNMCPKTLWKNSVSLFPCYLILLRIIKPTNRYC